MSKDISKKRVRDRDRQRQLRRDPFVRYDEAQKKRQVRADRKIPANLEDAPVSEVVLNPELDDPEIGDEVFARAIARNFERATRIWVRANPGRSSKRGKGWADDLRATRSVGSAKEAEFVDERFDPDRDPATGRRRGIQPSDDEDSGFTSGTNRSPGDLTFQVPGPVFFVIGRDSRPLPSYTRHASTVLDGADEREWQMQYEARVSPSGRRRVGIEVGAPKRPDSLDDSANDGGGFFLRSLF